MDICFLVLHYKTVDETKECINSILALQNAGGGHYGIVLIDNSAYDASGKVIKEEYSRERDFYYVRNDTNTFFSHGNNLGFAFAKTLKPRYMIVTNNDVVFDRKTNYIEGLDKIQERICFDILGPDIIKLSTWDHQNPYAAKCMTVERAEEDIKLYEKMIIDLQESTIVRDKVPNIHWNQAKGVLNDFIAKRRKNKDWVKEQKAVVHGSCIILGEHFIQKEEKIFTEITDFYGEEWTLSLDCLRKGYTMFYSPKIRVFHKSSVSINKEDSNLRERYLKRYQQMIKARKAYIKYLKKLDVGVDCNTSV